MFKGRLINSQLINNLVTVTTKRDAIVFTNSIGEKGDTVDSTFTVAGNGTGASYDRGYVNAANWRAGSPLIIRSNIAVAGVTTTQIIANQLDIVVNSGYKYAFAAEVLSNDAYSAIPRDTSIANIKTIITACKNAKMILFLGMTLPRSSEGGTALLDRAFSI
jgi:hypothetical protein